MERVNVSSSNLRSIGYEESTKTLEIEFKQGSVYQYKGVPKNIFENLMNANSHGTYFHSSIKDKYPTSRIN